jgi:cytochrome bd-type quinol oxidase subunit 2
LVRTLRKLIDIFFIFQAIEVDYRTNNNKIHHHLPKIIIIGGIELNIYIYIIQVFGIVSHGLHFRNFTDAYID